jgi:hypothetical protein
MMEPLKIKMGEGTTYTLYPDTGCNLFSECLSCPMPKCQYDMTQKERHAVGISIPGPRKRNRGRS